MHSRTTRLPDLMIPVMFRLGRIMLAMLLLIGVATSPLYGQVSPEEHAKHHPGQAKGGSGAAKPSGMGGGMMGGGMTGGEGMG